MEFSFLNINAVYKHWRVNAEKEEEFVTKLNGSQRL
jgi:hypothetical protein